MSTPMQVSEHRVNELEAMHLFYCNELPWRCSNPRCRDCSTAVADILNASGAGVNPCSNSFSLAAWCHNAERPGWFSDLFGHDLPGTFIRYEDAHKVPCIGLSGSNWGMNVDSNGQGHVEYILGRGKLTWGCHSHATDCGFDDDGIDTHSLDFFAVPPHFVPWLKPKDPVDWNAIAKLIEWKDRVSQPRKQDSTGKRIIGTLKRGDVGNDVLIMNQLLHKAGYLKAKPMKNFGLRSFVAIREFKKQNGWAKDDRKGNYFGRRAVNSILR